MKASIVIAFVAAFLGSCGGSTPPAEAPAPTNKEAPSCADVVAHVRALSIDAQGAKTPEQKDQAAKEIEPALTELSDECEAPAPQGWSPTFRSCVVSAKSREDVEGCDRANAPPATDDTHSDLESH